MSEPGFASLGPTLLARKGGAKPAMRPQVAPLVADEAQIAALADEQLEDLGWNDMGHDSAHPEDGGEDTGESGAAVVPINAAVADTAAAAAAAHNPIVRRQQRRLEERVLADAAMTGPESDEEIAEDEWDEAEDAEDARYAHGDDADDVAPACDEAPAYRVKAVTAPPPRAVAPRAAALPATRRAAFTLRLDPERHLKLRLAATMQNVSAQALVTEALDRLLAEFDELDVIAAHLKRH